MRGLAGAFIGDKRPNRRDGLADRHDSARRRLEIGDVARLLDRSAIVLRIG